MHSVGVRRLVTDLALSATLAGGALGVALPGLETIVVPETQSEALQQTRMPNRSLPSRLVLGVVDLANQQRYAISRSYWATPRVADGPGQDRLPITRVSNKPPGELVVPERAPILSIQPMPINTVNPEVSSSRGNEGLVMGITLTFP